METENTFIKSKITILNNLALSMHQVLLTLIQMQLIK